MGKIKVNQAGSMKISKDHKKVVQLNNSLINVLRPKVYITDSSSFKRLVQDLTGNSHKGNPISSSSSSSPPRPPHPEPLLVEINVPAVVIENIHEDHHHHHQVVFQESSVELTSVDSTELSVPITSFTTALESSSPEPSSIPMAPFTRTVPMAGNHNSSLMSSANNNMMHQIELREIESWLLEIDHGFPYNYDGYAPSAHPQEVFVYGYDDLSGYM